MLSFFACSVNSLCMAGIISKQPLMANGLASENAGSTVVLVGAASTTARSRTGPADGHTFAPITTSHNMNAVKKSKRAHHAHGKFKLTSIEIFHDV